MAQTAFYLEQAARCRLAAKESPLWSERNRFLAAEMVWRRLAEIPTEIRMVRTLKVGC
jgi:hypothetical protein